MKRALVIILGLIVCLLMSSIPMMADPGDETVPPDTTTVTLPSSDYPPPPPGYVGVWPPPDWEAWLAGGTPGVDPLTDGGGDEDPWQLPDD